MAEKKTPVVIDKSKVTKIFDDKCKKAATEAADKAMVKAVKSGKLEQVNAIKKGEKGLGIGISIDLGKYDEAKKKISCTISFLPKSYPGPKIQGGGSASGAYEGANPKKLGDNVADLVSGIVEAMGPKIVKALEATAKKL